MTKEDIEKVAEGYARSHDTMCINRETFSTENVPVNKMVILPIGDRMKAAASFGINYVLNNLWHDAQGDNLPEIDREVIVILNSGKVCFGHRPDPKKGYTGKSVISGNKLHYKVMTYGKGGWNIPDVKWWLDITLPMEGNQ